jgi:hypothetical protein
MTEQYNRIEWERDGRGGAPDHTNHHIPAQVKDKPKLGARGVHGLLVYCADYHCSHHIAISGDRWPDDVRLSDLEPKFTCSACGNRGADVRPDFDWDKPGEMTMGY